MIDFMKKIAYPIFLSFLLFSSLALAADIPTLEKYVNDYANVLSDSEETQINGMCRQIEENWTVEIAVLTVSTTQPISIEEYAVETFEKNGIGKAGKDNGLLIVAAIEDRQWRFEVGYGLEGVLNDAKAGRIGRTYLTPNFANGEYGTGLYEAVAAVDQVIASGGDDSFVSEQEEAEEEMIISIMILIFFVMITMAIFLPLIFAERCPNCGSKMKCNYDYSNGVVKCTCQKCGKKVRKKKTSNAWLWFLAGNMAGRGSRGGGWSGGGGGFGGGSSGGGGASGGW